jgi:hypothetical protein
MVLCIGEAEQIFVFSMPFLTGIYAWTYQVPHRVSAVTNQFDNRPFFSLYSFSTIKSKLRLCILDWASEVSSFGSHMVAGNWIFLQAFLVSPPS